MKTGNRRLLFTGIGVVVLLLVLAFGGAGMTAYAAQSALPGDALYPVKTGLEQTRISMARDAAGRARLHMSFAERRLAEIAGLIGEKRFENITAATSNFENDINRAIAELELVAQGDPEQAAVLTAQVSEILSRYARTLTSMLDTVPEPVRSEIVRAIDSSQGNDGPSVQVTETEFTGPIEAMTQGAWVVGGRTIFIHTQTEIKGTFQVGDAVKVHAALNGDGDLVAREIEPAEADDLAGNENQNGNGNENDDDGNGNANDDDGSANGNESLDDNGNDNVNDDAGNDNNNESMNANDNGDDKGANGNENESLNSNLNENSNDNGSQNTNDDANDNVNPVDNGNENGNMNDDSGGDDNSNDDSGDDHSNKGKGGGDDDSGNGNGDD